jgi:hypothetical protein
MYFRIVSNGGLSKHGGFSKQLRGLVSCKYQFKGGSKSNAVSPRVSFLSSPVALRFLGNLLSTDHELVHAGY